MRPIEIVAYEQVVSVQGEDAVEALRILDEDGEAAAFDYLSQWYSPGEHEVREESSAGSGDHMRVFSEGTVDWILNYNTRLGYIGLQRRTYDDQYEED